MGNTASKEQFDQATFNCLEVDSKSPEHFSRPTINEFEDIYVTYRPRVWALCLRMTGNPDDAEDLTQETFIRIYQKLGTFRGESDFCTWLRRVAINVVLLRFQKASWRRETPIEELSSPDTITGCPHTVEFGKVDGRLLAAIDRIILEQAIEQLPNGFKAVLILHDIEGYGHVEISELMGWSIGTSKSQLHKARLKMRELLGFAAIGEYASPRPETSPTPRKHEGKNQHVLQFPAAKSTRSSDTSAAAA